MSGMLTPAPSAATSHLTFGDFPALPDPLLNIVPGSPQVDPKVSASVKKPTKKQAKKIKKKNKKGVNGGSTNGVSNGEVSLVPGEIPVAGVVEDVLNGAPLENNDVSTVSSEAGLTNGNGVPGVNITNDNGTSGGTLNQSINQSLSDPTSTSGAASPVHSVQNSNSPLTSSQIRTRSMKNANSNE